MLLLGQHLQATTKDGQLYEGEIYYFSEEAVVLKEQLEGSAKFTMINLECFNCFKITEKLSASQVHEAMQMEVPIPLGKLLSE
jgi:hypothetical protein